MARPKTYHIMLSDNEVAALCKVIKDKKLLSNIISAQIQAQHYARQMGGWKLI